ncbi:MAG: sigma-70 family RNA polymerase sigma factor [Proteobacteria bacterium]|nr:sigma-70 family RNA polymerase sigma factor [Pseudomonadota bacterium]
MTTSSFQIEVPADLLARARGGDAAAFEAIYRCFERPAYTLALRMLGDADAARDTLHDAMLKVFRRIAQFRNEAPFWAWLRQIVSNEALMRLRRHEPPASDLDAEEIVDIAPPPWVVADARTLERALARLPALTRSVLWLYHVEGYTHPQIAAAVGKTTSFSKSQLARGTARLRALLDPPMETEPCLMRTPQTG